MKKTIAFLLSIFLVFGTAVSAVAQGPIINSVTYEKGNYVISGTWSGDKPLAIEVLKKTIEEDGITRKLTWEDVESAVDFEILNYLVYFNQTDELNEDGGFEFKVSGLTEEPEIRVYSDGEYFYHSRATLDKINDAPKESPDAPEEEFENLIMGYEFLNGKITEIINILDEDEKTEFWNKLYTYKEEKSGGFANFGEIVTVAPEIALLSKVMLSQNEKDLKTKLEQLKTYGIADSNSWDIYMKTGKFADENYLTASHKELLFKDFTDKAGKYNRTNDFVKYFKEKVVLTACHDNTSDYLVRDIIDKADVLAGETEEYSKLKASQKLKVAGVINESENEYSSISELAKEIRYAANEKSSDDVKPGSSSGGSGGSGSSKGGTGYSVVPSVSDNISQENQKPFSDISAHKWAEAAIYALREKGIVQGTTASTFEPERGVTREEFVKMLVVAMDAVDESASAPFADVALGAWYAPYVASAYNAKLVNGITDSVFGIGNTITREQLAVMIYRALASKGNLENESSTQDFTDIDAVSDFALDAVNYVNAVGLMNGMGDGSFAPRSDVTRAQAAKVIYELIQRL